MNEAIKIITKGIKEICDKLDLLNSKEKDEDQLQIVSVDEVYGEGGVYEKTIRYRRLEKPENKKPFSLWGKSVCLPRDHIYSISNPVSDGISWEELADQLAEKERLKEQSLSNVRKMRDAVDEEKLKKSLEDQCEMFTLAGNKLRSIARYQELRKGK
jgi:hypothetical protein